MFSHHPLPATAGGVGGGGALTAVPLVLPVSTVVLPVAAEDAGDTAVGVGALELTGQADVDVWGREEGRSSVWMSAQEQGAGVRAQRLEQQEPGLEAAEG